jgi:hypothetical protein
MNGLRMVVPAVLVTAVVTACGGGPASEPVHSRGETVRADLVSFDPNGHATRALGAISETPVDTGAFQGWFGAGVRSAEEVGTRPGASYVVVTGMTGCAAPTRAELVRTGDDLTARFSGGERDASGRAGCGRENGPVAQFAVRPELVRGVRTIGGRPPVDPAGPGHRGELVRLGPAPIADDVRPAELGTGGTGLLLHTLESAGSTNLDQARQALDAQPGAGRRGFAFVLTGCAPDGAALIVQQRSLTAKLTGDSANRCVAAAYFLVTFTIDRDDVPPRAVPRG